MIATGSEPAKLPGVPVDEKTIVTSTGALELSAVPKKMVVVGGGVIGLEMGSVWRRLGAEVTVVEFMDNIGGPMDAEMSKTLLRIFKKQGMKFKLSTKVNSAEVLPSGGAKLEIDAKDGGKPETLETDIVLVSTGRAPVTEGLGLDNIGVKVNGRGQVEIDDHFATNVPGIYAIGDVVRRGAMLAHKAEKGIAVIEQIAGKGGHVNYECIPGVIYTHPEVATVGKTEEELKAAGIAYKEGTFPFLANSRARANADTDGMVKMLADAETDRVLGIHHRLQCR